MPRRPFRGRGPDLASGIIKYFLLLLITNQYCVFDKVDNYQYNITMVNKTAKQLKLKAEKRNLFGRKVKKLRRQGLVPAIVYGKNFDSIAVQINSKDLRIIKKAGETSVISLMVGDKEMPVMIKQLQHHPIDGLVLHIDFYKVNLKEKVTTEVPLELVGEAPIAKTGFNVVQVLHEVEISALPTDLPKEINVDISSLTEEGQDIRLKDIKLPSSKIEFAEGVNLDETVVVIEKPKEELVEEKAPTEEEAEETAEAEKGEKAGVKETQKGKEPAPNQKSSQTDKTKDNDNKK